MPVVAGTGAIDTRAVVAMGRRAKALGADAAPQLRELSLDGNALGEVGGVAVGKALGAGAAPQLQVLALGNNAMGEAGMLSLAGAQCNCVASLCELRYLFSRVAILSS